MSDTHVDSSDEQSVSGIIRALIRDLEMHDLEKRIDIFVISGDLINRGGGVFGNQDSFALFEDIVIDPISQALSLSKDRFFFCPGNHDALRRTCIEEELNYHRSLLTELTSMDKINRFLFNLKSDISYRLFGYKSFEDSFYKDSKITKKLTPLHSTFKLKQDGWTIGIASFNSSWRSYDGDFDMGKILLGECQVSDALDRLTDCDIKIGIIHHPLDWISPVEKDEIANTIQREFDILFCGHCHKVYSSNSQTFLGSLFISVAPCNWTGNKRNQNRDTANGYCIIDFEQEEIVIRNRRYTHSKTCFDPNTDCGDSSGITRFARGGIDDKTRILNYLLSFGFEDYDKRLLTSFIRTQAPQTLHELFVQPPLVQKNYKGIGETNTETDRAENEIYVDIEELCNSDKNYLICGLKECGKTTLLDRIYIQLLQETRNQIPVYFSYNDVKKSRLETVIARVTGTEILKVREIITNNKISLIIDDLDLSDEKFAMKLAKFIEVNKQVRVIACTCTAFDGSIPLTIFDSNLINIFVLLEMKTYRSKEMRELTKKWFKTLSPQELHDKVETLIKLFASFNLTSNPLITSMLLWIIENQTNYRWINSATLIQNFLEKLFEKHSTEQIYRDVFDYNNQEMFLSRFAWYILKQSSGSSYSISYEQARDFFKSHLKERHFDFNVDEELKKFFNIGVLVNNNNLVYFRFSCFIKYYLARYMDRNREFKDFVFKEENYLHFVEEIDFYTGLYRHETEVLALISERMVKSFSIYETIIDSVDGNIDLFFEKPSQLARHADESKFRNDLKSAKPTEQEIDDIGDRILVAAANQKIKEEKYNTLTMQQILGRNLILGATVLKNLEEADEKNIKLKSFREVLRCSFIYCILYKLAASKQLENKDSVLIRMIIRFLPVLHQQWLSTLLGSKKLSPVIKEHIDSFIGANNTTDLELFTCISIYANLQAPNYRTYLQLLVKNVKRQYIYDMIFVKLINDYFFRSFGESSDLFYLNLVGDVIVQAKQRPKKEKGKIIQNYRLAKLLESNKQEHN